MPKRTVLLVNSDKLVLESAEQMLKNLGYEVLLAENGQEAADLLIRKSSLGKSRKC